MTSTLIVSVVVSIAGVVVGTQSRLLREHAIQRLETMMDGVGRIAKESLDSHDRLMTLSYLMFLQKTYPELVFAGIKYDGYETSIGAQSAGLFYLYRVVALPVTSSGNHNSISCSLRLGFSKAAIDAQVRRERDILVQWTFWIAGVFLLIGLLVNAWVSTLLTGPIEALVRGTQAVAAGNMDFSVPVRSSDELGVLSRRFNSMTQRLRDLLESREDILHTLTHEINTPLSGLKGYLELWQDQKVGNTPADTAVILNIMVAAVLRMESSLTNALKMFREEKVHDGEAAVEVCVEDIFNEVVSVYFPIAKAGNVEVLPFDNSKRNLVLCREELLRRIIGNLVSNAIKYTPHGGEVSMGVSDKGTELVLFVRNTGRGIPAGDIPHLFTKFYRSSQDRENGARIPGTGLGLNIVHKAVSAMGGRVWVESCAGQFTVFFVAFPKLCHNIQSARMEKL
ncbi:MAG TPA: HAMP domain-containing sensor histidine kinase [Bacteroidales bacterium]|nr:HAMP domain-containing sensor histidine kinase [Bacteroidales bacterium]